MQKDVNVAVFGHNDRLVPRLHSLFSSEMQPGNRASHFSSTRCRKTSTKMLHILLSANQSSRAEVTDETQGPQEKTPLETP